MAFPLVSKCFASLLLSTNTSLRTAAAMSFSSAQRVFQLKYEPLTGNSEWVVIEEEDDGGAAAPQDFQKSLLATTSYLDMLNDSHRNKCFREAIDKTVTQPCHVLDIGWVHSANQALTQSTADLPLNSVFCSLFFVFVFCYWYCWHIKSSSTGDRYVKLLLVAPKPVIHLSPSED